MIVVDTSALIAILNSEPERAEFIDVIVSADNALLPATCLLEVTAVALRFGEKIARAGVPGLIDVLGLEIAIIDTHCAQLACSAYLRFGKGRGHRAQLNQMDCFSYALAQMFDAPLLFKGQDFLHTDVRQALA